MDRSADPRANFFRYASGGWIDRVERPADRASIGAFGFMGERLKAQMKAAVASAGATAGSAPKGSATQLVGDFYSSYMNVEARPRCEFDEPCRV
ncbi:MAG: hypothetical protein AB7U49_15240 [Hyphomicrobiaceae bacterium]